MRALDLERAALPIFILIALAWYCGTRPRVPAVASVDGVYTNACCGKIVLRDGVMIAGTARVPFDLENMKFGLTAYPAMRLHVRGSRVVVSADADPGALPFDPSGRTITLCGDPFCKREYAFKRR